MSGEPPFEHLRRVPRRPCHVRKCDRELPGTPIGFVTRPAFKVKLAQAGLDYRE